MSRIICILMPVLVAAICFNCLILTPSAIDSYGSCLRFKYRELLLQHQFNNKFPATFHYPGDVGFVPLVLAKVDYTVDWSTENNSQANIEFKDVLKPFTEEHSRLVLIEGEPGIGKTTLAQELTLRWVHRSDELINKYKVAIFIQLYKSVYWTARDIRDLIVDATCDCDIAKVAVDMVETKGADILWILDGFDELPANLTKGSSILQLITGRVLPYATVIVTTRPIATRSFIHNYAARRIIIKGFNSTYIMQFASRYFRNTTVVENFELFYSSNPFLKNMLHSPLACYIVCTIFKDLYMYGYHGNRIVFGTMTKLYNQYVRILLKRHLIDAGMIGIDYAMPSRLVDKADFDSLPLSILWKDFSLLCQIAFDGVVKQKYIFGKEVSNVAKLSMMDTVIYINIFDVDQSSSFLHTTLQEYLAAIHLVTDSKATYECDPNNQSHELVLAFYTGLSDITNTKINHKMRSVLKKEIVIDRVSKTALISKVFLRCLYESGTLLDTLNDEDFPVQELTFSLHSKMSLFDYYTAACIVACYPISLYVQFSDAEQWDVFKKGLQCTYFVKGEFIIKGQKSISYLLDTGSFHFPLLSLFLPSFGHVELESVKKHIGLGSTVRKLMLQFDSWNNGEVLSLFELVWHLEELSLHCVWHSRLCNDVSIMKWYNTGMEVTGHRLALFEVLDKLPAIRVSEIILYLDGHDHFVIKSVSLTDVKKLVTRAVESCYYLKHLVHFNQCFLIKFL